MTDDKMIFAGFWKRFAAYIIDGFVINIFMGVIVLILFHFSGKIGLRIEIIKEIASWPWLICYLLYSAVMESSSEQATLGKIIMGLKVTDINGNKITFMRALGRNAGKILSAAILFMGFFMAGFTRKKQALHDITSNCLVLRYRKSKLCVAVLIGSLSCLLIFIMAVATISLLLQDVCFRLMSPTKLSDKPFILQEKVYSEEAPASLSEPEYDSILSSGKIDFDSGIKVTVGPAAFQLSNFMEVARNPHFSLAVRIIQLPNIRLADKKFAQLVINHVWDNNHKDVYYRDSPLEKEFYQRLHFSMMREPSSYFEANRDVFLISDVKEKDIESIEGELILKLPLNIELVAFHGADSGKEENAAGVKFTLKAISGSEVLLHYEGPFERFINAVAFDEEGKQLGNMGSSGQKTDNSGDIKFLYGGTVKTVKVAVARDFMERKYPFTLKK